MRGRGVHLVVIVAVNVAIVSVGATVGVAIVAFIYHCAMIAIAAICTIDANCTVFCHKREGENW